MRNLDSAWLEVPLRLRRAVERRSSHAISGDCPGAPATPVGNDKAPLVLERHMIRAVLFIPVERPRIVLIGRLE